MGIVLHKTQMATAQETQPTSQEALSQSNALEQARSAPKKKILTRNRRQEPGRTHQGIAAQNLAAISPQRPYQDISQSSCGLQHQKTFETTFSRAASLNSGSRSSTKLLPESSISTKGKHSGEVRILQAKSINIRTIQR